ncbi:MAG TPA: oligosaccharide flippase family protein [Patescibacteria group bacterium]|nr:oligosaccharide flippase family protein [Patescibacteria group bacterium]
MNFTNIKKLVGHPLISGSVVIFFGSMMASLLYYLFNLSMGRLLSAADYGILASLMSIFGFFSIFTSCTGIVFTKFSAKFVAQDKKENIGSLIKQGTIWIMPMSILLSFFIIILSPQINAFLHISQQKSNLIYFIAAAVFFTLNASALSGILQGLLRFKTTSILGIIGALIKISVGVGLVLLGFGLIGAVNGLLISIVVGYFLQIFVLLKFLRIPAHEQLSRQELRKDIIKYAIPVFASSVGITLFASMDIILVKHYFPAIAAGQYAALSLMGKSIGYLTGPIMVVFFPLIAQKHEKKERLHNTLILSLLLIGMPSLLLSLVYFLYPHLILAIFFPAKIYASMAKYLGYFSIFVFFFSLASVLYNFYLSIGKTYITALITFVGAILEVLYIVFFHQSIFQIIIGLIGISFLIFLSLVLYYPFAVKQTHE